MVFREHCIRTSVVINGIIKAILIPLHCSADHNIKQPHFEGSKAKQRAYLRLIGVSVFAKHWDKDEGWSCVWG